MITKHEVMVCRFAHTPDSGNRVQPVTEWFTPKRDHPSRNRFDQTGVTVDALTLKYTLQVIGFEKM